MILMVQASTWQRGKAPRLVRRGLKCWIVLLLVIVFSASGFAHVPGGENAAALSHGIASAGEVATGEACCTDDADAACCSASVCSVCVPLTSSAGISRSTVAEVVAALPDELRLGRAPSPGFRPPRLSANV